MSFSQFRQGRVSLAMFE